MRPEGVLQREEAGRVEMCGKKQGDDRGSAKIADLAKAKVTAWEPEMTSEFRALPCANAITGNRDIR